VEELEGGAHAPRHTRNVDIRVEIELTTEVRALALNRGDSTSSGGPSGAGRRLGPRRGDGEFMEEGIGAAEGGESDRGR